MRLYRSRKKSNQVRETDDTKGNQAATSGKTKESQCPYCLAALSQRPTRKKKCPHCGNDIYVRKPFLMTEKEAGYFDYSKRLQGLGVSRKDIDKNRIALVKQFGFDPPVNDVIWRTLNSLVTKKPASHEAKMAYHEMARICAMEGKDSKPYLREAAKVELVQYQRSGVTKAVTVRTCNDSHVCKSCRSLSGKRIPLKQALSKLPVPNECTNPDGCRCWYAPHIR